MPIFIVLFFGTKKASHRFMLLKLYFGVGIYTVAGVSYMSTMHLAGLIHQGPCTELSLALSLSEQANG